MKRSKRFFGFALSVALMCSLTTAFASQTASVDTTSADNDGIQRRATSFSFQLAANEMKQSSETYNIQDEDATLTITSMTWDFGAQELLVGWYNIDTGVDYFGRFTGGEVSDFDISSYRLPDGDYRVYVKNNGTRAVTGTIRYNVSQ